MKKKKILNNTIYHIVALIGAIIMVYPLVWMVMSSFKNSDEIIRTAQNLFPSSFTLENYIKGWAGFAGVSFSTFFKNSCFIAIVGTIGAVLSSAIIAFGFARCEFKGSGFWFGCVLISMMLPGQIITIPQYVIYNRLGWVGTYLPLIVPSFFGGAFFIFLIMQFMKGIPKDLDEAAKIDGCSIYQIFLHIMLPLVKPALVTSAIFSFMWKWDDFFSALIYLTDPLTYPVSYALKMFSDPSSGTDWGAMFAMATLSLVPIFIIFVTMQKYLVEGIASSGIKG